MLVNNNEYMHEYIVYVFGCSWLCFTSYDWSLEVMSQVIMFGNVFLEREKKKGFKDDQSIRWPWDKSWILYSTAIFFFFFFLIEYNANRWGFWRLFLSWTVRSVRQSTLICSPQHKNKKVPFFLAWFVFLDRTYRCVKSCLSTVCLQKRPW